MKVTLIPLAGRGERFKREGYTLPKPLIPVGGVPMVVQAARCLPKSDKYIFVCLQEHIDTYKIDDVIKKYFENAICVSTNLLTEGQASTCCLAEKYIHPDDQLTIGACDNGMYYDEKAFGSLMRHTTTDAVVWTFRNNPNVMRNPEHWGWVKLGTNEQVEKIAVKIPLSNMPMYDHAVVGSFSFKKAKYFFDNAKDMIRNKRRVQNEYYNDECINVLIENGLRVKIFEVTTYLGWGTPNDLRTYEYWSSFFTLKKRNEK